MKKRSFLQLLLTFAIVIAAITAVAVVMTLPASAGVLSGSCGTDVDWSLDTETGVLSITGTGDMTDFEYLSSVPWNSKCESIKSVVISEGVTSISDRSFYECTNLESIVIPEGVTRIGDSIFYDCASLKAIEIPASVTSIGEGILKSCPALESITVNMGNSVYHSQGNCLIETASGKLISGCKNSVIPTDGSIKSIEKGSFTSCSSLKSIVIPSSVTNIGIAAFYECYALESVTFEENSNLTEIGYNAFYSCRSLKSVEIPASVTTIGNYLFASCGMLESVTFEEGSKLTYIESTMFQNCQRITSIELPSSIRSIGKMAFENCSRLESITFGEGSELSSIGYYAFSGCSSLKSIWLPKGVTLIDGAAFDRCQNLATVYNCTSIDITPQNDWMYGDVVSYAENIYRHDFGSELIAGETAHYYECNLCNEQKDAAEHEFTEYTSNGDGTHSATCSCGKEDVLTCSGGSATCAEKAVCEVCGASYGELDADSHNYSTSLVQGEASHYYECSLCHSHKDEEEHEFNYYTSNGDNSHKSVCECGKKDIQNCSGGAATCSDKAVCEVCNTAYGDVDPAKHEYSTGLISDDLTHYYECINCKARKDEVSHEFANYTPNGNNTHNSNCICGRVNTQQCSGGNATCSERATCEICGTEYGEYGAHVGVTKNNDAFSHWDECECGAKINGGAHNFESGNTCSVCGYVQPVTVDPNVKNDGCGLTVSGGAALIVVAMALGGLTVFRKKEDR